MLWAGVMSCKRSPEAYLARGKCSGNRVVGGLEVEGWGMGRRGGGPGGECYNQPSVLESERSLEEWALPRILGCLTSR